MNQNRNNCQEHAQMNWAPIRSRLSPTSQTQPKGGHHDPPKRHNTQEASLAPEIQEDVVRIGKTVRMGRVPVRGDRSSETGQPGTKQWAIAQHLQRGVPEVEAPYECVAPAVQIDLGSDAREKWRNQQQQA